MIALEAVCRDDDVVSSATNAAQIERLWEVCQIPDYRKISSQNHADLVIQLYKYLSQEDGRLPEDWFARQVAFADRTDGDIDTLANRIAHIRTWTFVSNRADWLADAEHWQGRTREIEDRLSDALHEQLTQRFVDRRTSALMRGMRDKAELFAEIGDDGAVHVEKHFVGRLTGFRFAPDTKSDTDGIHGKAARNAAARVLSKELAMRVRRVVSAKDEAFKLTRQGRIQWKDEEIARLEGSDDPLKPAIVLLADDHLGAADREKVEARVERWLGETIAERLKPLVDIAKADDISGLGRGIAFQVLENFGCLKREGVAEDVRALDQNARAQLRKYGLRFGAFNLFFPALLKPAPSELSLTLWMLKAGASHGLDLKDAPDGPRAGLTSLKVDEAIPEAYYRVAGFHVCGPRAVRIDMLERLADLIRPLLSWRTDKESSEAPPAGATGDGGFTAIPEMMSILGCSAEELGHVLTALGFRRERRPLAPTNEAGDIQTPGAGETKPDTVADEQSPPAPEADDNAQTAAVEPAAAQADDADEKDDSAVPSVSPAPGEIEADAAVQDANGRATAENIAPVDATPSSESLSASSSDVKAEGETEQKYEDVWRPRRRRNSGPRRGRDTAKRSDSGRGRSPARSEGSSDSKVAGQRRQKANARSKKRTRPAAQPRTAAPPRKADKGPDPDSPFAALSKLKEDLEGRT